MAMALGQDMHQPRKRQGNGKEYHEQWHDSGQAEALQVNPKLNWHSGRVIRGYYHRAEFTDGPDPGNT